MTRGWTFVVAATVLTGAVAGAQVCAAPPRTFMGRTIAQTMSYHGASWLTRPERNAEENTDLLLRQLNVGPGDAVCDLGAGNGYHALKLAPMVAPGGRVRAVDIQPQMLRLLRARAKAGNIGNIETVLSEDADPKLGTATCDLILIVDVYHELSHPKVMLEKLKAALTKRGRIALVEFRAEDPEVPIKPLHKMSKAQMVKELATVGLVPVHTFDGLPWQHLVFFARAR